MGLLIDGKIVDVPGLSITPPAGPPGNGADWARIGSEDCRPRSSGWVRQVIPHTTGGLWPQLVRPGAGKPGHAQQIADMWSGRDRGGGQRIYSAAHLVVDFDGSVACLCDLARIETYHAEGANPWSIGIEMSTHPDGSIQDATLEATATLVAALTWSGAPVSGLFPIPAQMPRGPYRNAPIDRMEVGTGHARKQIGGPDIVGVLGHRDETSERGRGDPGDEIWRRLAARGFEGVDYAGREDVLLGRERQSALNARGERLVVDGVVGPASIAAMQRHGFKRWRDVA
jgi:hypothetical protein